MSINGTGMNDFGLNIKKFQKTQNAKFGAALLGQTGRSSATSFNSSIFNKYQTGGAGNPFRSRQSRMEMNFGYNADAIARLNQMQAQQNAQKAQGANGTESKGGGWKSLFSKETFKAGESAIKAYKEAFGSNSKKADSAKGTDKTSQAVNDIKTAEDKDTLTQAVDNASNEQKSVEGKEQKVNQQAKTSEQKSTQADKQAQQTEQKLNQSTQQLNQNQQSLDQAKADVQTCTTNYTTAQQKTSDCKQALEQAKSAATEDNPNTAAIAKAEADLKAAEAEELKAKQALEAAEQKETQAQQAVDKSNEQVKTDTTANTEAQQGADKAKTELNSVKTEQQTVQAQNNDLKTGIAEGEQKLEQMESGEQTQNADGTSETSQISEKELIAREMEHIDSELEKVAAEYGNDTEGLMEDPRYVTLILQKDELNGIDAALDAQAGAEVSNEEKVDSQPAEAPKETVKPAETQQAETPQPATKAESEPAKPRTMLDSQKDLIEKGNYTDDEKAKMNEAMDQVMNLEPGASVTVDDMTYTMDENGNITQTNSDGRVVGEYMGDENGFNKQSAAVNASSSRKRQIDTELKRLQENKLMGIKLTPAEEQRLEQLKRTSKGQ